MLVDAHDYPILARLRWHTKRKTTERRTYAQHSTSAFGRRFCVAMHRVIVGAARGEHVDHANGDGLDNRRENLRTCSALENSRNVTLSKNQKRGGYKGVTWHKGARKWEAYIGAGEKKPNGRRRRLYLGLFTSAEEAARAYDAAALEHFGDFAALNFPNEAA